MKYEKAGADYNEALKRGRRTFYARRAKGENPYLEVYDTISTRDNIISEVSIGVAEIPLSKVVGTKTLGRSKSFAHNFMPILGSGTEFAGKWINLCRAHMEEGIRDSIKVYEYLNRYYVEEGNKRVSVLKFFDAFSISANVTRLIPKYDQDNDMVVIYYEFLDFYQATAINYIWMTQKGNFHKLLNLMKHNGFLEKTNPLSFDAYYFSFRKMYLSLGGNSLGITTGDAFVRYWEIYDYQEVLDPSQMKEQLQKLWSEFKMIDAGRIHLDTNDKNLGKTSLIDSLASMGKGKIKIAFVNAKSPATSSWTNGHQIGIEYIKKEFAHQVLVESFNQVPEDEQAYGCLEELAQEGYQVIFTTSPGFINSTLKAALEYKNIKFLNCSESRSFSNIRTYFGRIYEPNFLVGVIAGALTKTDRLGYVVTYPIPEVISSINAFALGARFVNPNVRVYIKWVESEEMSGNIDDQLRDLGVDIICHQEATDINLDLIDTGIYHAADSKRTIIAAPVWNWGVFYEKIVRSILNGSYSKLSDLFNQVDKSVSYWWGMDTEVVDIYLDQTKIPKETLKTITFLKEMIQDGKYRPFIGPLYDNKGMLRAQPNEPLAPYSILSMDWFVEGVIGSIPAINPFKADNKLMEIFSVKKKYETQ